MSNTPFKDAFDKAGDAARYAAYGDQCLSKNSDVMALFEAADKEIAYLKQRVSELETELAVRGVSYAGFWGRFASRLMTERNIAREEFASAQDAIAELSAERDSWKKTAQGIE
jgi:hypothetical protein